MASLLSKHKLVFFIGFSGSGKTTVGRKIAHRLGFSYFDLDQAIEDCSGLSAQAIIETKGELYFRKQESQCLENLIQNKYAVIACGGGTPAHNGNMQLMNNSGITVYLEMSPGALHNRLEKSRTKRPLLNYLTSDLLLETIQNLLGKRIRYYKQAKIHVNAESLNVNDLMRKIRDHKSD